MPSISLHFLVFDYNLFPSIHRFILFFFTGVFSRDLSSLTLSISCKYFMRWHFHTSVCESYLFILTVNLSIILPISYFSLDFNISLVNFDFHLGLFFNTWLIKVCYILCIAHVFEESPDILISPIGVWLDFIVAREESIMNSIILDVCLILYLRISCILEYAPRVPEKLFTLQLVDIVHSWCS